VSDVSLSFFQNFDSSAIPGKTYTSGISDFDNLTQSVALEAKFLLIVKFHAYSNETFSEEHDRPTGLSTGARDLTWSHTSIFAVVYAKVGSSAA
jgi:glucoamylase